MQSIFKTNFYKIHFFAKLLNLGVFYQLAFGDVQKFPKFDLVQSMGKVSAKASAK